MTLQPRYKLTDPETGNGAFDFLARREAPLALDEAILAARDEI